MPDAVRDAIKSAIMQHGQKSSEDVEDYFKLLERTKRYQTETWS